HRTVRLQADPATVRLKPGTTWVRRTWFVGVRQLAIALLILSPAVACQRSTASPTPQLVVRSHPTMGADVTVKIWTGNETGAEVAARAVFGEFDRLDALMSVWQDGSEIQRLNRAAGDRAVPVGRDVIEVLRVAHQVSEWTGGKFDVTF